MHSVAHEMSPGANKLILKGLNFLMGTSDLFISIVNLGLLSVVPRQGLSTIIPSTATHAHVLFTAIEERYVAETVAIVAGGPNSPESLLTNT